MQEKQVPDVAYAMAPIKEMLENYTDGELDAFLQGYEFGSKVKSGTWGHFANNKQLLAEFFQRLDDNGYDGDQKRTAIYTEVRDFIIKRQVRGLLTNEDARKEFIKIITAEDGKDNI